MSYLNINISPLPFYDSLSKQNHRKSYAYGSIYPLIIKGNILMPFQFIMPSMATFKGIWLYSLDDETNGVNIHSVMQGQLEMVRDGSVYLIRYFGGLNIPQISHEGRYYLKFDAGSDVMYSEVFTSKNDVSDCIELQYRNARNFEIKSGTIDFSGDFFFKCYLQTQIGKPEYVFEEDATERGGYTFVEHQVSKKIFKFVILAPEYLCDALRIVRLCGEKRIVTPHETYDVISFSMSPRWEEQGDLAAVECEFEVDTIVSGIGGYEPELRGGDFNDDYNDDFNIY